MLLDIDWVNSNTNLIIYIMKTISLSMFTYYASIKILDLKKFLSIKYAVVFLLTAICIAIFSQIVENLTGISINSIIYVCILVSMFFSLITKNNLGYSILINAISLSINQILYFISISMGFMIYLVFGINNEYLNFLFIICLNAILVNLIFKIRKINKGIAILKNNCKNQYFDVLILNISIIILFLSIVLSNYNQLRTRGVIPALIIFSIIMFITIQKSLQLYYKQKMLVKDLEETKKELEDKKEEVAELEKENLNFSKISHTIAHRQKSLEHKLEELNMNSEISNELGARIEDITKDLRKETPVELSKTGISVIDDMLLYMQSECIKNKIDFQLQLNGNIYTMTNHYVGKDELEILLADHIKDAIIAIGYVENVNKSILVRLGKIDGIYSLYIYDSGIEFEIDTFMNLGIKPSTTHKDNGGTGMGFMNTFDTLRKYKASLEIEEIGKPCKDNFTKVLKFRFDNKNEFKIKSYRKDEIKKKDKENKLNLV